MDRHTTSKAVYKKWRQKFMNARSVNHLDNMVIQASYDYTHGLLTSRQWGALQRYRVKIECSKRM